MAVKCDACWLSWHVRLSSATPVPPRAPLAGFVKKISKDYQTALAEGSEVAQETLSSVRTVRSFAREDHETARYSEKVQTTFRMGAKKAIAYGAFGGVIGTTSQFAVVFVLWYGSTLVIQKRFQTAQLISFLLVCSLLVQQLILNQ